MEKERNKEGINKMIKKLYLISNYRYMMPEFKKLTRKQAENLRKQGYTVEQYN